LPRRGRQRKMRTFVVNQGMAAGAVFLTVLVLASWTDVRSRRIPNWITVVGMAAGLGFHAARGAVPLGIGALGLAAAFLVALPFFLGGALGGGDAKLLMVVGAFFGPVDFLLASLVIGVVGGALALAEAARQHRLGPLLASCGNLLLRWVTTGPERSHSFATKQPLAVPYGVAIAAGSVFWWFIRAGVA
jgi:prepilin peptidase CpaA